MIRLIVRVIKRYRTKEFSKRIARSSRRITVILTALSVVLPLLGKPVDGILTSLPYAWGSTAVVEAFYLWKAKNENRRKYAMQFVDKYADKYGIDAAMQISNIVLKD